jgi:chitodextrinase
MQHAPRHAKAPDSAPNPTRRRTRCLIAAATVLAIGGSSFIATQANAASTMQASLTMQTGSSWYQGGSFTMKNTGATATSWKLVFTLPSGTFTNNSNWNTDAAISGDRVTVTPKTPTPAGQSIPVSFGITGNGTTDLTVESCNIDGDSVTGCSADGGTPDPGDTTAPSVPASVGAAHAGTDKVTVTWKASTDDVGVDSYQVRRAGGATTTVAGTDTSITLPGHEPGKQYSYDVRAVDAAGNTSAWSTPASVTLPEAPDTTAPSAPGAASAKDVTATGATISWTASTDNVAVSGYEVTTRAGSTGDPTTTVVTALTHTLTGLAPDQAYTSTVVALDKAGNRSQPAAVSFTTDKPAPTAPGAPTSLSAAPAARTADLTWKAPTGDTVLKYEVSVPNTSRPVYETVDPAFTLENLAADNPYTVRVRAINDAGASDWTSLSFRTLKNQAPTTPGNPTATAVDTTSIKVAWNASTDDDGIRSYDIRTDGTTTTVEHPSTTTTIGGFKPGTEHTFQIRATDTTGTASAWTAPVTATTHPDAPVAPGTPTSPAASAVDASSIAVSWRAPVGGSTVGKYQVRTDGSTVTDVPASATTTTIGGFAASTTHRFAVRTVGTDGTVSPWTHDVSATTMSDAPNSPTAPAATAIDTSSIRVNWAAPAGGNTVSKYQVRTDNARVVDVESTATSTTVDGFAPATEHVFEIRAVGASGATSAWTAPVRATTLSDSPTDPQPELPALDIQDTQSIVPVVALGDASEARESEGRQYDHSNFQPTGRYAKKGQTISIQVPASLPSAEVAMGSYNPTEGGKPTITSLHPGENTIIAPADGMIHLQNRADAGYGVAVVSGGSAVPTYIAGTSTKESFEAEIEKWPSTRRVSFITKRMIFDIETIALYGSVHRKSDLEAATRAWDSGVEIHDALHGLRLGSTGLSARAKHKIYVTTGPLASDIAANATNGRIMYRNTYTSSITSIFDPTKVKKEILWHEVGHTYQPSATIWDDKAGEQSMEIAGIAVVEKASGGNYAGSTHWNKTIEFRNAPIAERDFSTLPKYSEAAIMMFEQLRRAFGDDFYARMFRDIRHAEAVGKPDRFDGRAQFAWLAASTAQRDLGPFFAEWGFQLDDEAVGAMAELPKLQNEIWNYHNRNTDPIEREIMSPTELTGAVVAAGPIVFGQRKVDAGDYSISGLASGVKVTDAVATSTAIGEDGARIAVTVEDPYGNQDVLQAPVETTAPSNSVIFKGGYDAHLGQISLDGGALSVTTSTKNAHWLYPGQRYGSAELRSPSGTKIAGGSFEWMQTASGLARGLDGAKYTDGAYLVVFHDEPSRLIVWAGGKQEPSTSKDRAYKISGGNLVPVPVSTVPGN